VKPAVPAAVLLAIIGAACGKVGDPKPPINRAPLAANGLSAGQRGYVVTLSWTNPAQYVDNNGITDLAWVRILRNGTQIAREKAQVPGQPQSYTIDVTNDLDAELTFAVQAETTRGRLSPISDVVRFRPKEIPGTPRLLEPRVDLDRIMLEWMPPERRPELAEIFLIQRSDKPDVVSVTTNHYEDEDYEPGKKYDYTITSARAGNPVVPGAAGAIISVTATDTRPPAVPTGLVVEPSGAGVFLSWDANKERDFKEYLVFRSDQPEKPIFPPLSVNGVPDENYRSGLTYQLIAVDKSGNESKRSDPKGGP
jgi:hypothetical protein